MQDQSLSAPDAEAVADAVACPACGAAAGKRCGWWQEPPTNPGYPQRRVWKHRAGLIHPERLEALRERLEAENERRRKNLEVIATANVLNPGVIPVTPDTPGEKQAYAKAYTTAVKNVGRGWVGAVAKVIQFPKARANGARGRERRNQPARSGSRSSSGSDDPGEPEPAADWHWRQPDSWAGLIASVRSGDFERELHLERWSGRRA